MNYDEIVEISLSYADREDKEVIDRVPNFILIVEARINRKLKVFAMSTRATLAVVEDQEYYGLPVDFGGLRDIQYSASSTAGRQTLIYRSPEQMNNLQLNKARGGGQVGRIYYTLIARQLQIYPPQTDGELEIVYFQKTPPLNAEAPSNWLSVDSPDCYIFGILVEISSFVKDKEAAALWKGRYTEVIDEIGTDDAENRWSGTSLQVSVG